MSLATWLWILTGVFCSAFLAVSWKVRKRATASYAHFVIGGGTFPLALVFFTDLATIMGVANFMGHASRGYEVGLPHLAFVLGEQGSKIPFALLFAGLAGRLTYHTLPELMDDLIFRDRLTRMLAGIIAACIMIAWVGGQGKGFGTLFHAITGANETGIVLAFSAIFILYTTMGGIYSVVWTDLLQGILVLVFGGVFYYYAFEPVGFSLSAIGSRLEALGASELWSFSSVGYGVLLGQFLTATLGIFAAQVYWQRCFAARNASTARTGLLLSGTMAVVLVMMTTLVGLVIHTLNPELDPAGAVSWFLQHRVPTLVAATIFALILAAGMSSADSNLHSAATLIVNDLLRPLKKDASDRWLVRASIVATVLIGIFAAAAALWSDTIVGLFAASYSFAGGSIVPLLLVGLLWKNRSGEAFRMGVQNSNVTPWGARVGLLTGGALTQIPALGEHRIFIAVGVSAALVVLVSLVTKKPSRTSAEGRT